MQIHDYQDGSIIHGDFCDPEVQEVLRENGNKYHMALFDPPYGAVLPVHWDHFSDPTENFVAWMLHWTKLVEELLLPGSAFCCWGGTGIVGFRPFYLYQHEVERKTGFQLSGPITWGKKRAYGIQWGYLYTREECAYFVLGNIKEPRVFNVPYLDVKRGYEGFDKDHPAKSEYLRRGLVWTDITEMFKGKCHVAQKPVKLYQKLIEAHSNPGEWVLDGFSGSATTAIAAISLGRRFMCVEKGAAEYDLGRRRIDHAYEEGKYGDTFESSAEEHRSV